MASAQPNGRRAQRPPRVAQELTVSHLRLENWRSVVRVDVALERTAFLVGPNAAGTSNHLDAFRFLADLVSVGGGFQEAVGRRGGVWRIRSLAAGRYPDGTLHVAVGVSGGSPVWRYQLAFTQDNRQVPKVAHERVTHEGRELLSWLDSEDRADLARLAQTSLERDAKGTLHLIGRYEHWRKHDAGQDEAASGSGASYSTTVCKRSTQGWTSDPRQYAFARCAGG